MASGLKITTFKKTKNMNRIPELAQFLFFIFHNCKTFFMWGWEGGGDLFTNDEEFFAFDPRDKCDRKSVVFFLNIYSLFVTFVYSVQRR